MRDERAEQPGPQAEDHNNRHPEPFYDGLRRLWGKKPFVILSEAKDLVFVHVPDDRDPSLL